MPFHFAALPAQPSLEPHHHHPPHFPDTRSPYEHIAQIASSSTHLPPELLSHSSHYQDSQLLTLPTADWPSYAYDDETFAPTSYGPSGHSLTASPNHESTILFHSKYTQQNVSREYSRLGSCSLHPLSPQATSAPAHLLEASTSIFSVSSDAMPYFPGTTVPSSTSASTIDPLPETLLSPIESDECLRGPPSSHPTGVYSPTSVTTEALISTNSGSSPPYSQVSGLCRPVEAVFTTTSISTTVATQPPLHISSQEDNASPGATQTLCLSQSCVLTPTPVVLHSDVPLVSPSPVPRGKKRDLYTMEDDAIKVPMRDNTGAVTGYQQIFGTPSKQRQPYSPKKRADVAYTRRIGACERCRSYKMKCGRPESPYELCIRCKMSNLHILKMPCFLAKPVEAELFRDKPCINHPLQTSRSEVYRLLDIEVPQRQYLRLELTQDFGETLSIYVTRFEPRPDEKTAHPWKDRQGRSRSMEMPPYCIARMDDARDNMLQYIENFKGSFLSSFLRGSNEITGDIFDEARRFSAFNPTCTVRKALDLFAANRIIERDWRICGTETLGLNVVDDPENPWFEKIPVTPIMDLQLDQTVIQSFLKPLRDPLLQELQAKIYEARKENWFEIFLTVCILLTNAERLLQHSRNNAKRYGVQRRYNSLDLAYSYFHACKILIAHFRFVCAGFVPLSLNWRSPKASTMAHLDVDQVRFMEHIQTKIRQKEEYLLSLKANHKYESELYWCHQLFFEKWDAGNPYIVDES